MIRSHSLNGEIVFTDNIYLEGGSLFVICVFHPPLFTFFFFLQGKKWHPRKRFRDWNFFPFFLFYSLYNALGSIIPQKLAFRGGHLKWANGSGKEVLPQKTFPPHRLNLELEHDRSRILRMGPIKSFLESYQKVNGTGPSPSRLQRADDDIDAVGWFSAAAVCVSVGGVENRSSAQEVWAAMRWLNW